MSRSRRGRRVVAGVRDPSVAGVVDVGINRAREPRRRRRVVDPMPDDRGRVVGVGVVTHEDATCRGRGPERPVVRLVAGDP